MNLQDLTGQREKIIHGPSTARVHQVNLEFLECDSNSGAIYLHVHLLIKLMSTFYAEEATPQILSGHQ